MEVCSICAWRRTCEKRFSVSGKDVRCIDFVKDVTIKEKEDDSEKEKKEK